MTFRISCPSSIGMLPAQAAVRVCASGLPTAGGLEVAAGGGQLRARTPHPRRGAPPRPPFHPAARSSVRAKHAMPPSPPASQTGQGPHLKSSIDVHLQQLLRVTTVVIIPLRLCRRHPAACLRPLVRPPSAGVYPFILSVYVHTYIYTYISYARLVIVCLHPSSYTHHHIAHWLAGRHLSDRSGPSSHPLRAVEIQGSSQSERGSY